MVSISENEARVVEFLHRNFSSKYNINQIARELNLSPMGSYKILKKLEKDSILIPEKIGNAIFYKINFDSDKAIELCKFVLTERKLTPYIKTWIEDLQPLKKLSQLAILFGSILVKDKKARDIDLLIIFRKKDFKEIQKKITEINSIRTAKIHDIVQTKEDFIKNIKNRDKVVLVAVQKGIILWGRELLTEVIKNVG